MLLTSIEHIILGCDFGNYAATCQGIFKFPLSGIQKTFLIFHLLQQQANKHVQRFSVWKLSFHFNSCSNRSKISRSSNCSVFYIRALHSLCVVYSAYAWIHSGRLVYKQAHTERQTRALPLRNGCGKWHIVRIHILSVMWLRSHQCSVLYIANDVKRETKKKMKYINGEHCAAPSFTMMAAHSTVVCLFTWWTVSIDTFFFAFKFLSVRLVPSLMLHISSFEV